MDLDAETEASIERNNAQNRYLESLHPPMLPVEEIMSAETFAEHRRKAQVIIDRLRSRCATYREGPRGE